MATKKMTRAELAARRKRFDAIKKRLDEIDKSLPEIVDVSEEDQDEQKAQEELEADSLSFKQYQDKIDKLRAELRGLRQKR